jgi:CopG family transcriptional regulator/antitoxin EndoAI
MRRRINITLPEETLRMLDRIVSRGDRSEFIKEAVEKYVKQVGRTNLRKGLKDSAIRESELDLRVAEEWFDLEEEACRETEE